MTTSQTRALVDKVLRRGYGLAPPDGLADMIALIIDGSAEPSEQLSRTEAFGRYFEPMFSVHTTLADYYPELDPEAAPLRPLDLAGPGAPPAPLELFRFADPSLDGIEYGFMVHAPELERTDYPIGEYHPRSLGEGVRRLGANFREGMQVLISRGLACCELTENIAVIESAFGITKEIAQSRFHALARLLDVRPDPAHQRAIAYDYDHPMIEPEVPRGWRFEPTEDGAGVLAPAEAFGDYEAAIEACGDFCDPDPEPILAIAKRALAAGHPASALRVLRESVYQNVQQDPGSAAALAPTMAKAYRALGRPLFAKLVKRYYGEL